MRLPARPLAIDLFTGLHGWAEGLIDARHTARVYLPETAFAGDVQ